MVVKNWLGFLEALTNEENIMCNTLEGLFEILTNKVKPQFTDAIKSLQFHKFSRQDGESAEKWLGRMRMLAVDCNYQEVDRQLKEQFIHGLNDAEMLGEIIRELTKVKVNNTINSETVLLWAKRVEVQRAQVAVMSSITERKEFDRIKASKRSHKDAPKKTTQAKVPMRQLCGYCGSMHPQANAQHTENVCRMPENWPLQGSM